MNRPTLLILVLLLMGGILVAGCTKAGTTAPSAQASATAVPAAVATTTAETAVNYLFVQEAHSGSFIPMPDGTYVLSLYNVVPYTIYFADRPYRIAGFTTMEKYLAAFSNTNPPNVAITIATTNTSEDMVIGTLSNPKYNATALTLVYNVTLLKNYNGDKLNELQDQADPAIPTKFGRVSLFIDSDRLYRDLLFFPQAAYTNNPGL